MLNADRHAPNSVNLPVRANDAVHEVPPYVGSVLLSVEQTHYNASVSQVAPLVRLLALNANRPFDRRELRHHKWIDEGE